MVARLHFGGRHLPLRGGSGFEHVPGRCAHATHRCEEMAHAARAVHILAAIARLVGISLNDFDAAPVRFHLIGDDHRQAGSHTGSHLCAVRHDGHGAIARDRDEHQRIVHHAARHRCAAVFLPGFGGSGLADQAAELERQREHRARLQHAAARRLFERFRSVRVVAFAPRLVLPQGATTPASPRH